MKKVLKKKKLIVIIALAAIAAVAAFAMVDQRIEVDGVAIGRGEVERIVSESGSVQSLESAVIGSKVSGQIASILVSEGDAVRAGQLLGSYSKSAGAADVSSLRAQLSGIQAEMAQVSDLAEKNKRLYEEGAISYEEYNQTLVARSQLEAQAAALRYSIDGMSQAIGSDGISSPIAGTVTSILVKEGEVVAAGSPLIEISNMEQIYVKVNLVSEDADEVTQGDAVRIYGESGKLIDENASVEKIYVKAQDVMSDLGIFQKRVPIEVKLDVSTPLRLGSDVNVEIVTDKKEAVIRVPKNAYFEINKQQYVYIIKDEKASLQNVRIGLEGENFAEALEGLNEGDVVILSPGRDIEDGVSVKVKE